MSYLDTTAIRAFASSRHEFACRLGLAGAPTFASPGLIGQEADKFAMMFFSSRPDVNPHAQANLARCAGYLVYAYERYGCRHEQVCEVSSLRVAQVLEKLTPDVRLPQGPRQVEQRSRLAEAGEVAQIVRLAEIRRTLRRLLSIEDIEHAPEIIDIASWVEDAYHQCGVMNDLRKHRPTAAAIETTSTRLAELLDKVDQRRRRDRRRKASVDGANIEYSDVAVSSALADDFEEAST